MFGVFTLSISNLLNAQKSLSFKIQDLETLLPVENVQFKYGSQSGWSNSDGNITIVLQKKTLLELTHLQYKTIILDPSIKDDSDVIWLESNVQSVAPITVVGLRVPHSQKSNIDVSVPNKMAHDAGALLRSTPVVNGVVKGGNYGYDPVVRGFKYDQLNIVLNGSQCASAACPNRMDPPTSQMAPNMVDKVEILKGPHALRYGVGLGATLNFVSNDAEFSDRLTPQFRTSAGYESNGEIIRNETMVGLKNAALNWKLLGSWSSGNDYKDGDGNSIPSDFTRYSLGTKLSLRAFKSHQFELTAMLNKAKDAEFVALPMDLRNDKTTMINVGHSVLFSDLVLRSWKTSAYISSVDHLMDNLLKPLNPRMMDAKTDAKTQNIGFRSEGKWSWVNSSLYTGLDYRYEDAEGIRTRTFLLGPNQGKVVMDNAWQGGYITRFGLFGEFSKRLNNSRLLISGRLNVNSSNAKSVTSGFEEVNNTDRVTQVNPGLSVALLNRLDKKNALNIWIGRAQRSAGIAERFINFFPIGKDPYELVGNPDLKAEDNHQIDLSWTNTHHKGQLTLDVYASYIKDYISSRIDTSLNPVMPNSPGVRRFTNIDGVFKSGLELSWDYEWFDFLRHSLKGAYTYAEDLDLDQALPEVAPFDVRLGVFSDLLGERLVPGIELRYVAKQDRISKEFGESSTPSFVTLDVSVSYKITQSFKLWMSIDNVLNESYHEHLNRLTRGAERAPVNARGRNVSLTASYTL